ncbi:MAG: S41 family peptidase [Candidatus Ratteibacteria bacterium]|nr:S41 family peptidase [Candidatus Ratteibacteria bacterium]
MKKKIILGVLIFSLAGFLMYQTIQAAEENLYENLKIFTDAMALVKVEYVKNVNAKDLIYGALKGMLSSLDSHSQFLDPDTYKEMQVETKGKFGGLGIVISLKDNHLTIISPLEGTPAYRSGIKANDWIVKINGETTKDITLTEAVKKLRGPKGTQVTITIMREGEGKLLDFTITRDIIKIESVKNVQVLEDEIGYVRLAEFQEKTGEALKKALLKLKDEDIKALILDLRNNPGGLLNEAVKAADKLLPKGKLIVYTQGRDKEDIRKYFSREEPIFSNLPMVILINGGSASASEIVAAAVQEWHGGVLLGTDSFGKGSVQSILPLKDGSALRLTTAKYLTPQGVSIQDVKVKPDILVEISEEDEIGLMRQAELGQEEREKLQKEDQWAKDIQLERAKDLLKAMEVYQQKLQRKEEPALSPK